MCLNQTVPGGTEERQFLDNLSGGLRDGGPAKGGSDRESDTGPPVRAYWAMSHRRTGWASTLSTVGRCRFASGPPTRLHPTSLLDLQGRLQPHGRPRRLPVSVHRVTVVNGHCKSPRSAVAVCSMQNTACLAFQLGSVFNWVRTVLMPVIVFPSWALS